MKTLVAAVLMIAAVVSPTLAADLKEELVALEKKGWTAWGKKDGAAFNELLTADAVQAVAGSEIARGRDAIIALVSGHDCEMKSFDFQNAELRQPASDVAILSYTATQDTTCGAQKLPSRVYATAVYVKQDGKWRSLHYQETPLG